MNNIQYLGGNDPGAVWEVTSCPEMFYGVINFRCHCVRTVLYGSADCLLHFYSLYYLYGLVCFAHSCEMVYGMVWYGMVVE